MYSIYCRPFRFVTMALLLCLLMVFLPVDMVSKAAASAAAVNSTTVAQLAGVKISDVLTKDGKPTGKFHEGSSLADKNEELAPFANYTEILMELFAQGHIEVPSDSKEEEDYIVTDPPKTDGGNTDYSITNVRTPGIDEPDFIKTDGRLIYTVNPTDGVAIVDASSMRLIKNISPGHGNLASETFEGVMLSGARLIIVGTTLIKETTASLSERYASFYVYNIANPANPVLERTVRVKGWLNDVRLLNNSLYITSRQSLTHLDYNGPLTSALPAYFDTALGSEYRLVDTSAICRIPNERIYGYTNISAFRIDANEPVMVRSEATYSGDSYMSNTALYLFHTNWGNSSTIISRYSLSKGMVYSGSATVSGTLLNEYAVDEYNGNLRVATTSRKSNSLFILDANLSQIGSVRNLAPGEQVEAVRFMGDTGYIVTFREIDPLFVLDLSNPRKPQVLGELKTPGFSNYLHPFGTKYLVGLGREITEVSYTNSSGKKIVIDLVDIGIKVSLFDVSDPKMPKELSKTVIGEESSYTSATDNPRMILADEALGLFAFPAFIDEQDYSRDIFSEESYDESKTYFAGIIIGVDPTQLSVRALLKSQSGMSRSSNRNNMRFCRIGTSLYFLYHNTLEKYDLESFHVLGRVRLG